MKKFFHLLHNNKIFFAKTLIIGIIYSGISVVIPVISGELISSVVSAQEKSFEILVLFLVMNLFNIIFAEFDQYYSNALRIRQKQQMREHEFQAFLKRDSTTREDISALTSFVNNDVPVISNQYFVGTVDIIKCVCLIVFSGISLIYIHWSFAVVIAGISILIIVAPKIMREKSGIARKEYSQSLGSYNMVLQSVLNGLHIVKTLSVQNYAQNSVDNVEKTVVKGEFRLLSRQLIVYGMTTFLQVAKTVLILIVGIFLISQKQVEVGGLLAVIQLAANVGAPIEVLAYLLHDRNEVLPLVEQYEERTNITDKYDLNQGEDIDKIEQISLRNVSCKIGEFEILNDVSAIFEMGKKYLIMGESGSGKSTLLKILARLDGLVYEGQIYCNNKEIREIALSSYYQKIGIVFQEPYLFYATLEENILMGRNISKKVYREIVEKLNLGYLLERYNDQEITPEVMEKLSGGEKQRIGLARAMIGKPAVYLLDEMTSALDANNSEMIEKLLLDEDAMIIHVCHKPNQSLSNLYDGKYILVEKRLALTKG